MGMALSIRSISTARISAISNTAPSMTFICRNATLARCCVIRPPRPVRSAPAARSRWAPVEGKGAVYSYLEVHHAIQPAFKRTRSLLGFAGRPGHAEGRADTRTTALRVIANLTLPNGEFAPPEVVPRSASAPACAWCSPMSLRAWRCRNGLSMRPHRNPRLFGGIRKNNADGRPASLRRRRSGISRRKLR